MMRFMIYVYTHIYLHVCIDANILHEIIEEFLWLLSEKTDNKILVLYKDLNL